MQLPPATPVADALASTGASARRSEIDAAPVTSAPSTATPSTKAATLAITSANAFPPGFRKPRRLGITGAPRRLIGTEDSNVPGAHVDEEYRASAAVAPPATRELSERTAESDASNGSAERSPPSYEGLSSSSKKRHSPSDSGADIASDGDGSASRACGSAATVVQPLLGGQNNEHQSSPVSATPPSVSKQEYIDLPTPISRSPLPRITSVEDVNMLGTSLMPHFASMDVTADVVQRTAVGGASAPSTGISPVESARSVDSSTVDGQQSTSAKSSAPASVPVLPTANKRNTLVV